LVRSIDACEPAPLTASARAATLLATTVTLFVETMPAALGCAGAVVLEAWPLCRPAAETQEFLPIATNAAKIATATAQTTASRRTQLS
jgi:hypothetical protein